MFDGHIVRSRREPAGAIAIAIVRRRVRRRYVVVELFETVESHRFDCPIARRRLAPKSSGKVFRKQFQRCVLMTTS